MDPDIALRSLSLSLSIGLLLTVVARKYELPTIVLLFVGGLALGPSGLGWVRPESLGPLLPMIVSLAIGIILFEGGLTLKIGDYLESPKIIKRLLTIGALITWGFATVAVKFSFGASWQVSFLAGSLVIVTGPTVIVPLLHRLRLRARIASILHWEGVLIDPIGVFVAVFCYEIVVVENGTIAVGGLALRLAVGLAFGAVGGIVIQRCLDRSWIPDSLTNPFALAAAVLVFISAEIISHEAGLLAVTLAGVIVARARRDEVRKVQAFKAEMTDLLIGTLFILLVSRLDPAVFLADIWRFLAAVAIIMFVARPLSILVCSPGSDLNRNEKLFLSWVAPRGIVAASMASLFALQLRDVEHLAGEAQMLETFVYTTICVTVVVQGLTAGWCARKLGVARAKPTEWLIVGANTFGRELAQNLSGNKIGYLLADSNQRNVNAAQKADLTAAIADAREAEALRDDERFANIAYLLALTDNSDLNDAIAASWRPFLGRENVYAWTSQPNATETTAAIPVFAKLPRPSAVSAELEAGLAKIELAENGLPKLATALMGKTEEGFLPVTDREVPEAGPTLCLVRQGSYLDRAITRGSILDLSVSSMEELYEALTSEAVEREPNLNQDDLLADLHAQRERFPPFYGYGVGAPHSQSPEIASRFCIAARIDPPLAVEQLDDPLQYVFLIVSPARDPEGHLEALSEIARHHGDDFQEIWDAETKWEQPSSG